MNFTDFNVFRRLLLPEYNTIAASRMPHYKVQQSSFCLKCARIFEFFSLNPEKKACTDGGFGLNSWDAQLTGVWGAAWWAAGVEVGLVGCSPLVGSTRQQASLEARWTRDPAGL